MLKKLASGVCVLGFVAMVAGGTESGRATGGDAATSKTRTETSGSVSGGSTWGGSVSGSATGSASGRRVCRGHGTASIAVAAGAFDTGRDP